MDEKHLVISQAAAIVGVHTETLRRLDKKGSFRAKRDFRGFRVYTLTELLELKRQREKLQG